MLYLKIIFFSINVDRYKLWLDPKKFVSPDIGA